MNYTLHQLKIFLEVVRQGTITKAADEMHMSQPALSIQLKNFQAQFDIPLTEIIGKKTHVTEFGKSISVIIENILNEAEAIKYKTKEYNGLFSGKLRISIASTGKYVIPYFLSDFLKNNSGIDLTLDVSNKTSVINSLKNNEIDFAFVSVLPTDLKVNEEILLENKLYLVGNEKNIENEKTLIYREDGSATGAAMVDYFSNSKERKSLKLTSNEAVKQACIAGIGYSILPLIGIKNELSNKQLYIVPSKGLPITTNWRLIWLQSKKLSPVAEAFLNHIKTNKYDIIQKQFNWYLSYR
ncbi:MAG: DNA-binding transcriptional LysR family regulator [Urechidicola sp.]|jgi:DNA-binding transcriptional LysR family regulator|tara:strand:- start:7282 stop:8172 length:891 start_codon:yes stop_codon:yes gene_type:complete